MEEAKGVVKHLLLAKFKDGTPPEKMEELIEGYAALLDRIEPMKAFHWRGNLLVACKLAFADCSSGHLQTLKIVHMDNNGGKSLLSFRWKGFPRALQ